MTTIQKSRVLSKKSIWRIAAIIVVVMLIGAGGYVYLRVTSRRTTTTATQDTLQTAKATVGNLVLFASGTGTIIPAAESNLSFSSNGQVSSVTVKVGDHVDAGQVLA